MTVHRRAVLAVPARRRSAATCASDERRVATAAKRQRRTARSVTRLAVVVVGDVRRSASRWCRSTSKICEVTGLRDIAQARRRGEHAGRRDAHACASSSTPTCAACRGSSGRSSRRCRRASGRADAGRCTRSSTRPSRPDDGPGDPELRAAARRAVFPASSTASASRSRRSRRASGAQMPVVFVHRSVRCRADAQHDHAVVHVLRGRGQRRQAQMTTRELRARPAARRTHSKAKQVEQTMSFAATTGGQAVVLRPAAVALADHGRGRAAAHGAGRRVLVQRLRARAVDGRARASRRSSSCCSAGSAR